MPFVMAFRTSLCHEVQQNVMQGWPKGHDKDQIKYP
jgi:hypothetical protein